MSMTDLNTTETAKKSSAQMPSPDLAELKAALEMSSMWGNYTFKWASFMTGWPLRQQQESLAIICNAAPALIAEIERLQSEERLLKEARAIIRKRDIEVIDLRSEIERLRGEVAKAKKLGAVEWHESKAEEWRKGYAGADNEMSFKHMAIAAELRKELA